MTYRMTAGIPVRDYVGEVEFTPDADGTEIRWCVRFRPSIPLTGGLLSRALQRGLQDILDRLCRLDFGKQ
jgi:hypothetical protein